MGHHYVICQLATGSSLSFGACWCQISVVEANVTYILFTALAVVCLDIIMFSPFCWALPG